MFIIWNSEENILNFSQNQSFVYEKEDTEEHGKDYLSQVFHHKTISVERANELESLVKHNQLKSDRT